MMTIQNSQTPRRKHEDTRTGKQYPDERDRQRTPFIFKTSRDDRHDVRGREHTDEHDDRGHKRKDAEDRIRDTRRFLFIILGQQLCVDRNERRGQRSLAEDVLQEVWNAKRGAERVAFTGTAEVVRKDSLPDQTDDAADENSGADKECRTCCARRRWFRWSWRFASGRAYLFDSFTGDRGGRFVSGDFGVSCQRAYSFILFRSVL